MNPTLISSDRVEGTSVYNLAGDKLGTIDCVMIDKLSGHTRYAVLEFGGFLGMGTDLYPVPWSVLRYDTSLGGYVVPITADQLEAAPKYDKDTLPDYSDSYGRSVSEHYGALHL
ncbi:PRC-barrel domain-containing protein [Aquabacterium sp. OR-4]|uniref:PRC-barrel domain-containing protein n=1 Tax=Aquabacterium sp. OR-4 TaxID=2978127 RepID=UPI0021B3AD6F|nr:PRC-barrel domain-containing protein [Aquabacterium sp. OR-4]MDT7835087.1 PRC-barrel domain-containing protein [Aquabacterium sp. OR-4]